MVLSYMVIAENFVRELAADGHHICVRIELLKILKASGSSVAANILRDQRGAA